MVKEAESKPRYLNVDLNHDTTEEIFSHSLESILGKKSNLIVAFAVILQMGGWTLRESWFIKFSYVT